MSERQLAVLAGTARDITVAVNPDAVWYLRAGEAKARRVQIYSSAEHAVTVFGDFESAASLLGFDLPAGWQESIAKTLPRAD